MIINFPISKLSMMKYHKICFLLGIKNLSTHKGKALVYWLLPKYFAVHLCNNYVLLL